MLSVCIASIIRVVYIAHVSLIDQSWSDTGAAIWSIVELSLAIVCACLPTLRPLILYTFYGGYAAVSTGQSSNRKPADSTIRFARNPNDALANKASMTESSDTTSTAEPRRL